MLRCLYGCLRASGEEGSKPDKDDRLCGIGQVCKKKPAFLHPGECDFGAVAEQFRRAIHERGGEFAGSGELNGHACIFFFDFEDCCGGCEG